MASSGLRQRNSTLAVEQKCSDPEDHSKNSEEIVWGKTPGGKGQTALEALALR
jgi:hypothetical protein